MPFDLQVVFPQEVVPTQSIEEIAGCSPRLLLLRGTDFTSVSEVTVNDIVAPMWYAQNKNMLLVRVPESEAYNIVSSVRVLSSRATLNSGSLLRFRIGSPGAVSGIMRLLQLYTMTLINSSNFSRSASSSGAGISEAKIAARMAANGRRAHQMCRVEMCPCRTFFSWTESSEACFSGKACSISLEVSFICGSSSKQYSNCHALASKAMLELMD